MKKGCVVAAHCRNNNTPVADRQHYRQHHSREAKSEDGVGRMEWCMGVRQREDASHTHRAAQVFTTIAKEFANWTIGMRAGRKSKFYNDVSGEADIVQNLAHFCIVDIAFT